MDKFAHDRIIIGMVLSLGLAHLLKGVARMIERPSKPGIYPVHLLWVFYTFMLLIDFWWWEYRLGAAAKWYFASYLFVVFYITCFYLLCSLLIPDDITEYPSYKEYYFSKGSRYFLLLAIVFLVDLGDTLIKGRTYFLSLGVEYPVRIASHFLLCLLAYRSKKEWVHVLLAILFIVYGISWIVRVYGVQ